MPTPKDDPNILKEWKKLEKELAEKGYSQRGIYNLIATIYGVSASTVDRWLNPEHKEKINEYLNNRNKVLKDLGGTILEIFNYECPVTADEISNRIKETTGISVPCEKIRETMDQLINMLGENSPIIETENDMYQINRNSPYWRVCNGYWRELVIDTGKI